MPTGHSKSAALYHLYESDRTRHKALPTQYERSLAETPKTLKPFPALALAVFVTDHSHTAPRNRSDLFYTSICRTSPCGSTFPPLKLPGQWLRPLLVSQT